MQSVECMIFLVSLLGFVTSVIGDPLEFGSIGSIVQCENTSVIWTGGSPPYNLSVYNAAHPNTPFESFSPLTSNSFFWKTDLPAGTTVFFIITDAANDAPLISKGFPVSGDSTSSSACLNGTTSSTTPSSTSAQNTSTIPGTTSPSTATPSTSSTQSQRTSSSKVPIIVGATVGSVGGAVVLAALVFFILKKAPCCDKKSSLLEHGIQVRG